VISWAAGAAQRQVEYHRVVGHKVVHRVVAAGHSLVARRAVVRKEVVHRVAEAVRRTMGADWDCSTWQNTSRDEHMILLQH
jgi:hypothetical protein